MARDVGPFAGFDFLTTWRKHHQEGSMEILETAECLMPLWEIDGVIRFLGAPDVTDYHSPLGSDATAAVASLFERLQPGTPIVFDSLPVEAAEGLVKAIESAESTPSVREHETAMVLAGFESYGQYLERIPSKRRHELRRKRRRFSEALGDPFVVRGPDGFSSFVELHRSAAGDKASFMTSEMEAFFLDLATSAGAVVDLLLVGDRPVAAAFGFEDDRAYYLYNSAFDRSLGGVSPGVVLIDELMRLAFGSGRSRFDFLKGTEEYKARLGAVPRPLFVVEAST